MHSAYWVKEGRSGEGREEKYWEATNLILMSGKLNPKEIEKQEILWVEINERD